MHVIGESSHHSAAIPWEVLTALQLFSQVAVNPVSPMNWSVGVHIHQSDSSNTDTMFQSPICSIPWAEVDESLYFNLCLFSRIPLLQKVLVVSLSLSFNTCIHFYEPYLIFAGIVCLWSLPFISLEKQHCYRLFLDPRPWPELTTFLLSGLCSCFSLNTLNKTLNSNFSQSFYFLLSSIV